MRIAIGAYPDLIAIFECRLKRQLMRNKQACQQIPLSPIAGFQESVLRLSGMTPQTDGDIVMRLRLMQNRLKSEEAPLKITKLILAASLKYLCLPLAYVMTSDAHKPAFGSVQSVPAS